MYQWTLKKTYLNLKKKSTKINFLHRVLPLSSFLQVLSCHSVMYLSNVLDVICITVGHFNKIKKYNFLQY